MLDLIFILIPVFRHAALTRTCLARLAQQSYREYQVVLLDHSGCSELEGVEQEFPRVSRLVLNPGFWWAGAVAAGVDWVLSRGRPDDQILTLNHDVRFDDHLLEHLAEASQVRHLVACWCSSASDGREIDVGGRYDWPHGRRVLSWEMGPEPLELLHSRGVLYPFAVFEQLGNFRCEELPHYYADAEMTYRAFRAGYSLSVCRKAELIVDDGPELGGVHALQHLTLRQLLQVFTSRRSCFQPAQYFRFIDICCPPRWRFRTKLRYSLQCLSWTLGRTWLGRHIRRWWSWR